MNTIPLGTIEHLVELTCTIQQIPGPTFFETKRAQFIQQQFSLLKLDDIFQDSTGNVRARLAGGSNKPVVISAHLDTVHPEYIPLTHKRQPGCITGPAIGDNSLGLAVLVELARFLIQENEVLPGDVWFVANTCEEGLGNLIGMQAIVNHFLDLPQAYIVLEGLGLGRIYHRGLAIKRFRITFETPGGHSWVDYGQLSAIHEIARLVSQLTSMRLPFQPRTTLNVGSIEGGTSINTIAARAVIELDLRSEESQTLDKICRQVNRHVIAAEKKGLKATIEDIGHRPFGQIPVNHPLVRLAESCLIELGIQPHPEIASTDANLPLSRGLPAICIGITNGGNTHSVSEYIYTEPIFQGFQQVVNLINRIWTIP